MQSAVFVARVHGSVTLPKSFPALAQNATIKYEKPVPRPGKRRKFVITQSFAAHAHTKKRKRNGVIQNAVDRCTKCGRDVRNMHRR